MANIIFLSAVQKFRGVNKIEVDNLILTIPVLVLIALAVVMIIKAFYILFGNEKSPASAKSVFIKVLVPFILINALYFSVAYFFYSELGVDLIFLPLISGALAGFCNLTLKANSFTNNILEVFLIAIVPYGISGYAGIALAIITATLFANFVGRIVLDKKPSLKLMTYKMAPLIFLFATTEIRENSGLITRFNLSSGIQIGWLILGAVVLEYFHSILQKLTEIFKNNEIGSFLPFAGTVFTIGLFTIIIKVGNDEAIVSSLVSAIIYLVLLSILDYTRYKNRMRLAYAYANCIGVLSFLILTKI